MPWTILQDVDTGIVAIHVALLPTSPEGDILCFGDWAGSGPEGVVHSTLTRIYHVGTETLSPEFAEEDLPDTNGFCGGQAFLSDGRLLLAGGTVGWPESHAGLHDDHYEGERACWIYLPREQRWTRVRDLRFQPGSNSKGGGRWYPTLVTLPDGQVFAVAGHPAADDDYNGRHNNNTPERYSATSNWWTLMTADITAPNTRVTDSYPRYRLLPNGRLFTDTVANGGSDRIMDPYSGAWVTPDVDTSDLPPYYNLGSAATSVLLPLQPPAYRPRILACNSPDDTAFRIDVAGSPEWDETPDRQTSMEGADRENGCAVLLPTGQVLLCGGWPRDVDDDIASATLLPELYTPGINWSTGEFSEDEEWVTLDDSEASEIGRGYHSVALLLPDGRVWAAGSTSQLVGAETRIDIYSPSYVGHTRPTVQSAPTNVGYGRVFNVTVGNGNQIQRVALIRCGSVTHGFNSDQRYVGLAFSQNGNTLTITAPPNGMIAPPGYYMLWVVTSNNRPCELAPFIRLSNQQALLYVDRSTFSVHEVDALGLPAHFYYAFYFILDGFLPHEVGEPIEPPDIVFEYSNGDPVPGMHFELATTKWEDPTTPPDTAQRLTFACHIRFDNQEAFDQITGDSDDIILRATHGVFSATANLVLSTNPNPWMRDGDVQWLSTDVRVFQMQPGMLMAGVSQGSGSDAPYDFIQNLLDEFNSLPPTEDHPFFEIAEDPDESQLSFAGEAANGQPVYNYAVAKVRMTAPPEVTAEGVGVFFRLFTTSATGFEYNTSASYDREGSGADSYPVLGRVGGDIATIPFFAEARADDGDPQSDSTNRKDIEGGGAQEVHTYFGCWLDINQETPEFEEDGEMKSVQEILKGEHQCLVAELNYDLDPIPANTTPGSNENLSQRNLVITPAPNPASPATRIVAHTVEIAPSKIPAQLPPNLAAGGSSIAARLTPDELVFSWRNVPTDTQVTLYLPDVDVEQVLALAARRQGPPMVERVDAHTLRLKVGGITYVPLPGGRTKNIPALLTMQLPPNLVKGTIYKATIKQFDGQRRRILGSIQLKVPITTAEAILPEEIRKLAVFRHIASKLANTNKWFPIFERYLGVVEDRVRGLGGNPDEVLPSPTGNPPLPRDPSPLPERERETGKITEILYDCFGGFEGFVLATCDGHKRFKACERGIEEIVWKACKERGTVTIYTHGGVDDRILKIVVHCC